MRVVSLVPSQSELLADLGVAPVGVTRFCVHPTSLKERATIVGGTKQVDVEKVRALRPDWILANKEENTPAMVEARSDLAPVHVTDVRTLDDALAMIETVGRHVGKRAPAARLARTIAERFDALSTFEPLRCAYLIWRDPLMTVGGDTFISDVMARAGLINAFADQTRYPITTPDELSRLNLDAVLLSSEPFPFSHPMSSRWKTSPARLPFWSTASRFRGTGAVLLHAPGYLRSLRSELERVDVR